MQQRSRALDALWHSILQARLMELTGTPETNMMAQANGTKRRKQNERGHHPTIG